MTTSINIYTVDAGTAVSKQFAVSFTLGFLSRDHVSAFVEGELDGAGAQIFRTITWITDGLVQLSGTLVEDDVVTIQRTTPADALQHDFQAGAVLNENNLDEANLQALMILHEVFDGRNIGSFSDDINMNGFNIDNAGTLTADAVSAAEVTVGGVTLSDLDAVVSAEISAANVLAKLLTVDGTGSGLDADKVQGVGGAVLARTDTDLVYSAGPYQIRANTSDGSDTSGLILAGGGDTDETRGAYVFLYGAEHALFAGNAVMYTADTPTSFMDLYSYNDVYIAGAGDVNIDSGGTLALTATTAVTVPTAPPGTNSTVAASTAYADAAVSAAAQSMHVQDQKASGTSGGATSAATLHTRTLNTVVSNTIAGASLATNKITLPAGTYDIQAAIPMYRNNEAQPYLYNVTDAAYTLFGQSAFSSSGSTIMVSMPLGGRFTIAGTKEFEIRHYCTTAQTDGFGRAATTGQTEVYTNAQIWKVA